MFADAITQLVQKIVMSIVVCAITTAVAYLLTDKLPSLGNELEAFFDMDPGTGDARLQNKTLTSYEKQVAEALIDGSAIDDTLESIGGMKSIKEELRATVVLPLQNPYVFFDSRMRTIDVPRGILLCGPPGTGKTMIARALAHETNASFLSITLSMLENKYYGETSKLIKAAFSLARKLQPCIIFFDEIDGMLKERRSEDQHCTYSFKTELLSQMDGFTKNAEVAVIVIACTNAADRLDAAVRRRLPKCIEIGLPDKLARKQILTLLTQDEVGLTTRAVDELVETTDGWSGSDLHDLYRTAVARRSQRMMRGQFMRSLPQERMTDTQVAALRKKIPSLQTADWEHAKSRIKQKMKNHLPDTAAPPKSEEMLATLRKLMSSA